MDNATVSDFFYRTPVLDPSAQIAARTTPQIDNDADFLPDPAPQTLVDDILAQNLDPSDYLVPGAGSPSGYVLRNPIYTEFPGGYNPNSGADLTDLAAVLGLRGEPAANLTWDLRARYAGSAVEYTLSATINPSLGSLSPLRFRPGTLTQEESGLNVDFVKTFENSPLNVAFGAELRNETNEVGAGDLAAIVAGPTASRASPWNRPRSSKATAGPPASDLETDLTERLSGAIAFRYEDYDEFGDTFDWKVSGRFQVTDAVALRATANTGLRVPTPGQVNTLNVTTSSDSSGNLIPNGTYPVTHPIAVPLGAAPLEPEESTSCTAGIVWERRPTRASRRTTTTSRSTTAWRCSTTRSVRPRWHSSRTRGFPTPVSCRAVTRIAS